MSTSFRLGAANGMKQLQYQQPVPLRAGASRRCRVRHDTCGVLALASAAAAVQVAPVAAAAAAAAATVVRAMKATVSARTKSRLWL